MIRTLRRMRPMIASVVLALVSACVTPNPPPVLELSAKDREMLAAASNPHLPRPFFWRVDGPKGPSWLLGTLHVAIQPETRLPPQVLEAMRASRVFVMEWNPYEKKGDEDEEEPTDEEARELMRLLYSEAGDLSKELSEPAWKRLIGRVRFLSPSQVARLKPAVAYWLYLGPTLETNAHLPEGVFDFDLLNLARRMRKRLVFLDTKSQLDWVDTQLGMEDRTVEELESLIMRDEKRIAREERRKFYAMILDFVEGRIDKRGEPLELGVTDTNYEVLIGARNRAWMERLEPLLAEGGAFIAVGVGHMTGKDSLIRLIRAAGYEVRYQGHPKNGKKAGL